MKLAIILICLSIYYRIFRVLNDTKDYFRSGIKYNKYLAQEILNIDTIQLNKKKIEKNKNEISLIYKNKLLIHDHSILSNIMNIRTKNIYNKYILINNLNTELINHSKKYLIEQSIVNYNKYLTSIINIILKHDA